MGRKGQKYVFIIWPLGLSVLNHLKWSPEIFSWVMHPWCVQCILCLIYVEHPQLWFPGLSLLLCIACIPLPTGYLPTQSFFRMVCSLANFHEPHLNQWEIPTLCCVNSWYTGFPCNLLPNLSAIAHCSNQHCAFWILVGSKHLSPKSRVKEDNQTYQFFLNKLSILNLFSSNGRPSAGRLIQLLCKLDVRCPCSFPHLYQYLFRGMQWREWRKKRNTYLSPLLEKDEKKHFPSKPLISFTKGSRSLMRWGSQEHLIYLWKAL